MTRMTLFALIIMVGSYGCEQNVDSSTVFDKVIAAYESMDTYKAHGIITSAIDTGGTKVEMDTSFSMVLKKPNMYVISWTRELPLPGMSQSGALWSDGTQPYVYMSVMNAYAKMEDDEVAMASATGISGGAASMVPSLFLPVFKERSTPFSRLRDPKITMTEKVGDEDCYVISGWSAFSKEETYWVSKASYLIKKHCRSLEPPEDDAAVQAMTDEALEESVKARGREMAEDRKKLIRKTMEKSMENSIAMMRTVKLKGSSTQLNAEISSPELSKSDFTFSPPEGTVLKESLFGEDVGSSNGTLDKVGGQDSR